MAQYEHLPIYKAAFDLAVYFDGIVSRFSRQHRYTHGAQLCNLSREIVMLIVRANSSDDKAPALRELRVRIEELKLVIRLCKEVKAFPNFNSFETSINKLVEIARQNEGWMKSLSAKECGRNRRPMPKG